MNKIMIFVILAILTARCSATTSLNGEGQSIDNQTNSIFTNQITNKPPVNPGQRRNFHETAMRLFYQEGYTNGNERITFTADSVLIKLDHLYGYNAEIDGVDLGGNFTNVLKMETNVILIIDEANKRLKVVGI